MSSRSWVHSFHPLVNEFANDPGTAAGSPNRLFVRSSTAFMMVCMPNCLKDGSVDRSFFRSSKAFRTVCMPCCSADRSLDRLFFRSSMAFPTVWVPYGSTEGKSAHLWVHSYLPPVDDFANVLHAVDCSPYRSFFRSSMSIIPGRFAYRIPRRMAADYSYLRSSTAFTTVCSPYCSAAGTITRSWLHSFHPLVYDFANVAPAVDCSPYRSFFRLSTTYPTFCVLYCSTDGATA